MIGYVVFVVFVVFVLAGLILIGRIWGQDGPPATRRELDRAERDNRPDITPALAHRDRALPSMVVVVVQAPARNDDPRRWN